MRFSRFFKLLGLLALLLAATPAAASQKKLMVYGDSLVAGYGLALEKAFPAQLEKKLQADGHDVKVINAGVSGETTAGGLARLDWTLQDKPDCVILVTGGNDMLRAIDPKHTRENLKKILDMLKARKIPVLVAGMRSYRNLGAVFGGQYQAMYEDLADEYDAVFYPFFLDGVAMDAMLNQDDGMHPNERGVAVIVDKIYDDVEDLLEKEIK